MTTKLSFLQAVELTAGACSATVLSYGATLMRFALNGSRATASTRQKSKGGWRRETSRTP